MTKQAARKSAAGRTFGARGVYVAALAALLASFGIGYGIAGPRVSEAGTGVQVSASAAEGAAQTTAPRPGAVPIRQMADQQAAPLMAQLARDPRNPGLLLQVGAIYYVAQQYQDASGWYAKAVAADPGNVAARDKLAGSLYREGDADGAIAQLRAALRIDPTDANSLYNLGAIDLQSKGDARDALAAWQTLLRTNPQLSAERKAAVLQTIANTMNFINDPHALEGAHRDAGHKPKAE